MLNAKPLVYLSGCLYAPIECLLQCKGEILLNRRVLHWLWVTFQSTKCHMAISQQYSHSWRELQNGYSMANDLATRSVSLDIQDCNDWGIIKCSTGDGRISMYPPIILSAHLFVHYIYQSIHLSIQPSLCPSMHSSFCLCLSNRPHVPPIHLLISLCLSIHPAFFPSIHLPTQCIWCYERGGMSYLSSPF